MKSIFNIAIASLLLTFVPVLSNAAEQAEILWLGQATTKITTPGGKIIVIDPFLKKNPKTPKEYKDLAKLGKVDLILITHGHFDHVADASELAKLTGAKVVANGALAHQLVAHGMVEKGKAISMNKTGTITPLGPDIKIHMVPAEHSSALTVTHHDGSRERVYGGAPVGYVIKMENGKSIYHSGDTGIFGDMALINKLYKPDLALICIGGHFTMAPAEAAIAITELIKPKQVIPIHYGTFGLLKGTPDQLKSAMGSSSIPVTVLMPGQSLKL